ncbi:phosphatase PAP2 family protein [Halobacillus fulvus]|nr:phosphatase PAP2 family protein [Halobacillus fulvus]
MYFSGTKLTDLSKASIIVILAGFAAIIAGFYAFAELAEDVLEQEKFAVDQAATNFVMSIEAPWMGQMWGIITDLGSVTLITIASIILFVYLFISSSFSRWVAIYFAVTMGGIALLTKLLKLLFERSRPEVLAEYDGTGFSFPSGHSTGSIVFYGFLVYLVIISSMQKKWKWTLNTILTIVFLLVGLSRVYLGVHYFTDVIAGFSFGLSWLLVCIAGLELTLWNQRRRKGKL